MIIDRQRVLDLIDQLRISIPSDIEEAAALLKERDSILAQGRTEVERLLQETELTRQAQERARQIVMEAEERADSLVQEAEAQARARLDEASNKADAQRAEADLYAIQSLRRLESQILNFLNTIRRGIDTFEDKRR